MAGLTVDTSGMTVDGACVFNEAGASVDFRIGGEYRNQLVFCRCFDR